MPGEFVPHGYLLWLRTWLTDEREVGPMLWAMDTGPIDFEEIPQQAFDSEQEKQRVEVLIEQYNHPNTSEEGPANDASSDEVQPGEKQAQPSPADTENSQADDPEAGASPETATGPQASPSPGDEEAGAETDDEEQATTEDQPQQPEMTPAIDAGFAQLARERITRAPVRYYLWLPLKRAAGLWFNPHSQYYPFEGELFAPPDDEHDTIQQLFLPLFTGLTWIYTFLGIVGGWFLWQSRDFGSRRWLLLAVLIVVLRLGFFSLRENPEPRYVVELFPFIFVLGGIAAVRVLESFKPKPSRRKPGIAA
jgi:hypothetical protein